VSVRISGTRIVGPVLTTAQFVRAVATASPAAIKWFAGGDQNTFVAWRVINVDADFDDETGRTKLSIEAEIELSFSRATLETIAFQATILAAI
jgi:hypothetical protein